MTQTAKSQIANRKSQVVLGGLFLAALMVMSVASLGAQQPWPRVELKLAFPELIVQRPIWLCEAPDSSKHLFLVEQRGRILILPQDRQGKEATTFLDMSDRKPYVGNEEGLLGLAFHPKFKSNGQFYIYYTQHEPRRSVISELRVSRTDPLRADLSTERILMEVPQPYENHNGGELLFGPDNFLYVSLGDGGSANDPHNNGQNLQTVLGKILRLDVDTRSGGSAFGIPRDNPFVGRGPGTREEIWAYGLRNVWRMSFDRQTGELWAGDVGQNKWEEVDVIVKGGNYGWRIREGFHPFDTNGAPAGATWIDPVIEYPHNPIWDTNHTPGLSITGGYVYRGHKVPSLRGVYLYGDFALGTIWGLRYEHGNVTQRGVLWLHPKGQVPLRNVASFGEDAAGELYVLCFEGTVNGRIYEFEETEATAASQ
jgi:glucose/arabinose dehydrogenase